MPTVVPISCGEHLDISQVHSLFSLFQASLSDDSAIELQADEVTKVDSAGLQLVLCFSRALTKKGGSLTWTNPSQVLIDTASLLGLSDELQLM